MEASDGSSLDDKTTTYSEAIAIRRKHPVAVSAQWKHPVAVSTKSSIARRLLGVDAFPFRLQAHQSHSFLHRTTFALRLISLSISGV
jgi:hypothetical protein